MEVYCYNEGEFLDELTFGKLYRVMVIRPPRSLKNFQHCRKFIIRCDSDNLKTFGEEVFNKHFMTLEDWRSFQLEKIGC